MILLLAACLPDLRGKLYEPYDSAEEASGPKLTSVDEGDGIVRVTADATSASRWVHTDLDARGEEVEDTDPGWDLAISRQRVKLNGGSSGSGGVEVSIVQAERLELVTTVPAGGWVTDLPDDDDENSEPEYAFDAWFDYDDQTHVLTPKPLVFVVRTTESAHAAVEIVDYYDDAGTSGYLQYRWRLLDASTPGG